MHSSKIDKYTKKIVHARIFLVGIIILGIFVTYSVGQLSAEKEKERLKAEARIFTHTINPEYVQSLSGSMGDLANPKYQHIKTVLTDLRSQRPELRFIYLMGHRAGEGFDVTAKDTLFFYVDSEDPSSKDYSRPGDIYDKTGQPLLDAYKYGEEFVDELVSDRWGTWISVFVPVIDPNTKQVVALLGTDTDASDWKKHILLYELISIVIFGLLICIVLVYLYYVKKVLRLYEKIEKKERDEDVQKESVVFVDPKNP